MGPLGRAAAWAHAVRVAARKAEHLLHARALAAARTADRLPLAPKALGRFAVLVQSRRRRRGAARASARWRELQAPEQPGGFSDWTDYREQHEIERCVTPDPVWLEPARRLQQVSAERAVRLVVRVVQRNRRGWTDEDLWSLTDTLRRAVGAQLTALAEQTNGYPSAGEWGPDGAAWSDALRHHGQVLSIHPKGLTGEERAERRETVRASLHWVADHYEHLAW